MDGDPAQRDGDGLDVLEKALSVIDPQLTKCMSLEPPAAIFVNSQTSASSSGQSRRDLPAQQELLDANRTGKGHARWRGDLVLSESRPTPEIPVVSIL